MKNLTGDMNMKRDLISIIVPIYNQFDFLRRCVDSIINQTYQNLEIILVDDGSFDGSSELCDEYAEIDGRIKVIHKSNGGLSSARNEGLNIASGEYIQFVDSDDYIDWHMTETLYEAIKSTEADMVVCNYHIVNTEGGILEYTFKKIKKRTLTSQEYIQCTMEEGGAAYIPVWNKLYKRHIWDNYRYRIGKLREDEFALHHIIEKAEKIMTINDELYYYTQNSVGIMHTNSNKLWIDFAEAYVERLEWMCEKNWVKEMNTFRMLVLNLLVYVASKTETEEEKKEFRKIMKKYNSLIERKIFEKLGIKDKFKEVAVSHCPILLNQIIKIMENIK